MAEDRNNPLNDTAAPVDKDMGFDILDDMPQSSRDEFESFIDAELGADPSVGRSDSEREGEDDDPEAADETGPEITAESVGLDVPEPAQPQAAVAPPQPVAPAQPVPRWQVGNELLTAQEIIERGHFNNIMAYATQLNQRQVAPEPPPQVTPEQLVEQYRPMVDSLIDQGYIEPSFADTYPGITAGFIHLLQENNALRQRVDVSHGFVQNQERQQQIDHVNKTIDDAIDNAAGRGELFARLKDHGEREKFRSWLVETDPKFGQINGDFVARLYLAYNYNAAQETAKRAAKPRARSPETAQASSEAGATRAGHGNAAAEEPWADMYALLE